MAFKLNTKLVNTEAIIEDASSQISDVANGAVSEIVAPVYTYDSITFGTEGNFVTSSKGLLTWDGAEHIAWDYNGPDMTQVKENHGFRVKAAAGAEITAKFYPGYGQYFLVDGVRVTSDTYTITVASDKEIYVTTDNPKGSYIKEFNISKLKSSINDVLFNGISDLHLHGLDIGYSNNRNASNGIRSYGNVYLCGDVEAESRQPADYSETRSCVARTNVDSNYRGGAKFSSCVYDNYDHFVKFKMSSGYDHGDENHWPLIEMVASYNETLDDDYSQFKIGTAYAKLETNKDTGDEVNQVIDVGSSESTKMILSVNQNDDDGSGIITKATLGKRELELYVEGPKDEYVTYENVFKISAFDNRPKFSFDGGKTYHYIAFLDDVTSSVMVTYDTYDGDQSGGESGDSDTYTLTFERTSGAKITSSAELKTAWDSGYLGFKSGRWEATDGPTSTTIKKTITSVDSITSGSNGAIINFTISGGTHKSIELYNWSSGGNTGSYGRYSITDTQ